MTNKPILESIIEFVNSKEKTKEIDTTNKNEFAESLPAPIDKKSLSELIDHIDKYRIQTNLIKREIKRLAERLDIERDKRDRLDYICQIAKKYLTKHLNANNKTRADVVSGFKLSWRPKNAWLQILEKDLSKIPEAYLKRVEPKIDYDKIKLDLEAGKVLEFAKLSNNGEVMLTISKKRIG